MQPVEREFCLPPIEGDLSLSFYDRRALLRSKALKEMTVDPALAHPYWLVEGTNFHSSIWHCQFGEKYRKMINFSIRLIDGTSLDDKKNGSLLGIIKLFIAVQFHPRFNGGFFYAPITAYYRLKEALHVCDWLILKQDEFGLAKCLLQNITRNDLRSYIKASGKLDVWEASYKFSSKLEAWLISKVAGITDDEIQDVVACHPGVLILPPVEDRSLKLSDEDLIAARVYFIKIGSYNLRYGEYTITTGEFVREAYENTLHGMFLTPEIPPEFRFGDGYRREYDAVDVRDVVSIGHSRAKMSKKLSVLKRMVVVDQFYCPTGLKVDYITGLSIRELVGTELKIAGRYLSLPANLVFKQLRNAIEFSLANSQSVLNSVISFLNYYRYKEDKRFFYRKSAEALESVSGLEYKGQIVESWTVTSYQVQRSLEYFTHLRSTPGLYEMYRVLLGSIQFVIGALAARRQGEIAMLENSNCLLPLLNPFLSENEQVGYFLQFSVEKTGHQGKLEIVQRPIPTLVAKLIWTLREFNLECLCLGLGEPKYLINTLSKNSLEFTAINSNTYNRNFDYFCDFFETTVVAVPNCGNCRYYIRQHQLRRFFAMAFFWSGVFDGLEAVRYMLCHSDLEDLYHYITESNTGEVLNGVKSERIAYSLLNGNIDEISNVEALRDLLVSRYKVSSVHIKTIDEIYTDYSYQLDNGIAISDASLGEFKRSISLEYDIFNLLESKAIKLEPDFIQLRINGADVQNYKLILKIGEE